MSDIAIVSANIGAFDDAPRGWAEQAADTFYYTNEDCEEAGLPEGEHPRLTAKRWKMLEQRPYGDYQYIIWIDSNMTVLSPTFAEDVVKACGDAPLALWRHPDRDNIRDEAEASYRLAPEKYADQPIRKQVAHYCGPCGFADNWGLYATGVICWNLENRLTERIASAWLNHCQVWSYQDQISLPYVLWVYLAGPALLPYNLRHNPFVSIGAHLSNR